MADTGSNSEKICIYMTAEQKAEVKAAAGKYRMTVSVYARKAVLGGYIPDPSCHEAVQGLYGVRSEMRRLCGLIGDGADASELKEEILEALAWIGDIAIELGGRRRTHALRKGTFKRGGTRSGGRRGKGSGE